MKAIFLAFALAGASAYGQADDAAIAAQQATQLAIQANLQATQQAQQDAQQAVQANLQASQAAQDMQNLPSRWNLARPTRNTPSNRVNQTPASKKPGAAARFKHFLWHRSR